MEPVIVAELVGIAIGLGLGAVLLYVANRWELRRLQRESDAFVARLTANDAAELDFLLNASPTEIEEHLKRRDEERQRGGSTREGRDRRARPDHPGLAG